MHRRPFAGAASTRATRRCRLVPACGSIMTAATLPPASAQRGSDLVRAANAARGPRRVPTGSGSSTAAARARRWAAPTAAPSPWRRPTASWPRTWRRGSCDRARRCALRACPCPARELHRVLVALGSAEREQHAPASIPSSARSSPRALREAARPMRRHEHRDSACARIAATTRGRCAQGCTRRATRSRGSPARPRQKSGAANRRRW